MGEGLPDPRSRYTGMYGCWTYDAYGNRLSEAVSATSCGNITSYQSWANNNVSVLISFQLPTSCTPIMMPSSMSVSRDMPRQITVFPGGGS